MAEETKTGALFSPEAAIMISIAILLDLLSIICIVLILVFGAGLFFAKIVYLGGLTITSAWIFFRSGALPGKEKLRRKMVGGLTSFLRKNWKMLTGKAVPVIGDALPLWTWMVYSELTGR